MLFSDINILDENLEYHQHCWVGIMGNRIHFIHEGRPEQHVIDEYEEIYNGSGKLLMSGFYNAHAHAPMVLLRGYAESLPLQRWLNEKVFPFEAKITAEDMYWATLLACAEQARFGIVSFSDMYMETEARIRAATQAGMKMNVCDNFVAFEDKPYQEFPNYEVNEKLVSRFHGSDEGRILVDYCIHAEYSTQPEPVSIIAQIVKEKNLRVHLHLSETKAEHEECKQRHHNMTPTQYFNSLGIFDNPTTAAHCVWVEDADLEILKEKGVFVACNPVSNMKLGSGFAPISAMLEKGIAVALGTDGMASNNNHDMMQDMYLMALIYKGYNLDPAVVTPQQCLHAATRIGALSQGRDDCGVLKEGAKADLVVVDMSEPSWTPNIHPLNNVVYAGHGSDICLTMVDGRVVYRDGIWPTIDVERAKAEVTASTKRIIASL